VLATTNTVGHGGCKPSAAGVLARLRALQARGTRCVLGRVGFRSPIHDAIHGEEH